MTDRAYRMWVGSATLVGLAVRLLYAFAVKVGDVWRGDAYYYHYQAKFLTEGWWFVNPDALKNPRVPRVELYSAQHPPLFTLFLALSDELGFRRMGAQKALLCIVGALTVVLVAVLAREMAGKTAGVLAAVIASLYPGFWVYDGEVMSEALLMLLTAATLLVAYRCWREPSVRRLVLVGAGSALTALTRSEMILLVPLLAVPLAWRWRDFAGSRGGSLRPSAAGSPAPYGPSFTAPSRRSRAMFRRVLAHSRSFVLVLGAAALVLLPWTVRNLVTFEHPVLLSDQFDITLAAANNSTTYANGPLFGSWCYPCVHDIKDPVADESVQAVFWKQLARQYVEHHLGRVPAVVAARVGLTWDLWAPVMQAQQNRVQGWPEPVSAAWLWWYYALLVASVAGAIVLRRRKVPIYPLMALAAIVTLASIVTYGNIRFRSEAEVALVVLASVAVATVVDSRILGTRSAARALRIENQRDDGTTCATAGEVPPSAATSSSGTGLPSSSGTAASHL